MTNSPAICAFGAPAARAVVRTCSMPIDRACAPDVVYARLRAAGHGAGGLLETTDDAGLGCRARSLVAARSLLRLQVRGDRAQITALVAEAEPLLPSLRRRLPGSELAGGLLQVAVPVAPPEPGLDDDQVLRQPSLFCAVRALAGLLADDAPGAPMPPGLLGAFGYELVDRFEALGKRAPDPLDEPDLSLVLVGDAVVYDHGRGEVTAIVRALPWELMAVAERRLRALADLLVRAGPPPAMPVGPVLRTSTASDPVFLAGVRTLQRHIAVGDVFQAVLSRSVPLPSGASPVAVYRRLGAPAATPWRFLLDLPDGELLGASPEASVCVADGQFELRPLAGTVPRGRTAEGILDPDLDHRLHTPSSPFLPDLFQDSR